MPPKRIPIYLYIQNPKLNARLTRMLLKAGYEPFQLNHYLRVDPCRHLLMIDTDGDVAYLSQVVYHLYLTYKVEPPLPILALVPEKALKRNPMLWYWLIDGRAAITQIIPYDKGRLSRKYKRTLLWFLRRLFPFGPK